MISVDQVKKILEREEKEKSFGSGKNGFYFLYDRTKSLLVGFKKLLSTRMGTQEVRRFGNWERSMKS